MIVSLNGWPGAGKLTIALELAELMRGRVLDNHSLFNVANALTEFRSLAYYQAAREVRQIAFKHALSLPATTPLILTNVIARGGPAGFAEEHWEAIRKLAAERRSRLVSVRLECDPAEQARRIVQPERRSKLKLRDPAVVDTLRSQRELFDDGADLSWVIDTTSLSPDESARTIVEWINTQVVA